MGCAKVSSSFKIEDLQAISSPLIFSLKGESTSGQRRSGFHFLSPGHRYLLLALLCLSRRQAHRKLIIFFLITLLCQLSFPNHLTFQPHQCYCWLQGGKNTRAALAHLCRKMQSWCLIAESVKAVPILGTQMPQDGGEELLRRKGCIALHARVSQAHTSEASVAPASKQRGESWSVASNRAVGDVGKKLQGKSIHSHTFILSLPSPSPEKVNATSFVFLKISLVNVMRPLTVTSSQHLRVILTIQQHPRCSKELENTSSAENTNISAEQTHLMYQSSNKEPPETAGRAPICWGEQTRGT